MPGTSNTYLVCCVNGYGSWQAHLLFMPAVRPIVRFAAPLSSGPSAPVQLVHSGVKARVQCLEKSWPYNKLNICLSAACTVHPYTKVLLKKDSKMLFVTVFRCYKTKHFCLATIYIKVITVYITPAEPVAGKPQERRQEGCSCAVEGQSPSHHHQESAEDVLDGPEEGPGLSTGQLPQPHQVQEACIMEASACSPGCRTSLI
jgi:hypothetical protein